MVVGAQKLLNNPPTDNSDVSKRSKEESLGYVVYVDRGHS